MQSVTEQTLRSQSFPLEGDKAAVSLPSPAASAAKAACWMEKLGGVKEDGEKGGTGDARAADRTASVEPAAFRQSTAAALQGRAIAAGAPGGPTGGKDGEPRAGHGNSRFKCCPSAQAALGEEGSSPL